VDHSDFSMRAEAVGDAFATIAVRSFGTEFDLVHIVRTRMTFVLLGQHRCAALSCWWGKAARKVK
jgi:hypothetical protein